MISYRPFFDTLLEKGLTDQQLIKEQGFSTNAINQMNHNLPIGTNTIDALCNALDCEVQDIIKHIKD